MKRTDLDPQSQQVVTTFLLEKLSEAEFDLTEAQTQLETAAREQEEQKEIVERLKRAIEALGGGVNG